MAYSDEVWFWADYLNRVNKTMNLFPTLNQTCESTIKLMYHNDALLLNAVKKQWGAKKLSNHQIFVSIFYKRNILYLQSSHALACIGFVDPSHNLNRTVFETLLREYLFIVDPAEADEYYNAIGKPNEFSYHSSKGMKYMRQKLYRSQMNSQMKNMYSQLCTSSHPDIKGAAVNYPRYPENLVRDNLMTILSLAYTNMETMAECFMDFLDSNLKESIRNGMENIASETNTIPTLEPDKEEYAQKIKLKGDNFVTVLV